MKNKLKALLVAGLVTAGVYIGDNLDVKEKTYSVFHNTKEWVVDVFTKDTGERTENYLKYIQSCDDQHSYFSELTALTYELSMSLPESTKKDLAVELIKTLDAKEQRQVFGSVGIVVYDSTKKNFEDRVKDLYQEFKEKVSPWD